VGEEGSTEKKESIRAREMFHRLNVIVPNELKNLGQKVDDEDFSHWLLRCLPPWFDTLVTIIVRRRLERSYPHPSTR
jgi:hypothetical protein